VYNLAEELEHITSAKLRGRNKIMEPLVLNLFLRSLDACYDATLIQRFLEMLVSHGFRVIAKTERRSYDNVEAEVTFALQQDVHAYLTQHNEELMMRAYPVNGPDLSILVQFVPEEGLVTCSVEQEHFYGSDEGQDSYLTMLDIFKEFYQCLHPFYGHEDYSGGVSLSYDFVVNKQAVNTLYFINFFGPELVNKLGRDRLLGAPAWKIEELDDGGIFLVPTEHIAVSGGGFSLLRVARHLGMETPQAPDEEWDGDDEDEDEE
jgi:hypothetical protein